MISQQQLNLLKAEIATLRQELDVARHTRERLLSQWLRNPQRTLRRVFDEIFSSSIPGSKPTERDQMLDDLRHLAMIVLRRRVSDSEVKLAKDIMRRYEILQEQIVPKVSSHD